MFESLTWQKDPLLLDPEPLEQNAWLTANDLLSQGKRESIFTPTGQFRLYSLMLRKIDFVSGERLLQGFPYLLLGEDWCERLRRQTLLLVERAHHYFIGAITNTSIRSWQKKLIHYLEDQQRLPFPLFRLADDWEEFFTGKQFVRFQSARGEPFQLPLYLTEELAYLVGVVMGDGHLAEFFINIIDSSREHIENLARLLEKHFHSKIEVFEQSNANAWNVNILGKWLVRFINFLSSQPINERKYPHLCQPALFCNEALLLAAFWRGIMDADGSYKSTILLGSASQQLITDFESFLQQHTISFNNYTQEVCGGTTYSVSILGKSRKAFVNLLGSLHPQKQKELETLLTRKVYRFSPRPHTLLRYGKWKGQVLDFNKSKLINGFFDLSFCPYLSFSNLGAFLRDIRKGKNIKLTNLAQQLSINSSLLSKYELNTTAIPIPLFQAILNIYEIPFLNFLKLNPQLEFRSGKTVCQFATSPSDFLLQLLLGLKLSDNNYFLIVGSPDYLHEFYKSLLSEYFKIQIIENRRFQNAALRTLVQEFCILQND